ncbi:MAG: SPFH domain-containing protein [Lachnospiraceae bacterium]|nr:SPFH domain-containing protein [Lachnospiraceae bacterium]
MGLISAALNAAGGVMADQWKEYFYCDALAENVLMKKGSPRHSDKRKSANTKGESNIISNGSIIAVNEGQCMLIVEQGKVVDICAEPGEFVYDASTEPSIFCGKLGDSLKQTLANIGKRFTFGGDAPKDQRVYFVNIKEIMRNKYGTPTPVPFRVVNEKLGLDMDTRVQCHGQYSFHIVDPIIFYTRVCANVTDEFTKESLLDQMKTEINTALAPALAKISALGVRYSEVPAHTKELTQAMKEELSEDWTQGRGIEIASFGIDTLKLPTEIEKKLEELSQTAVFTNPGMAAANLSLAQAEAMKAAASNTATGPMMAFAGMNMAAQAGGINAGNLFAMQQQQQMQQQQMQMQQQQAAPAPAPAAPAAGGWDCACGHKGNTGNFCAECGARKPDQQTADGWICPSCQTQNKGKFCSQCGTPKPAGEPLYKCDKCGWEPEDPHHPPKFCPQCGDPFDEKDITG